MGAKTNFKEALTQVQKFPAKDWTKAFIWYLTKLFESVPGLQVGTTIESPPASGTFIPTGTGETNGELYVSNDLTPAQVWVWQGGAWWPLGGGGPGPVTAGVLYKDFLLGGITEPYVGLNYTPTFAGGLCTNELWVDSATSRNLKSIDYTYVGGVLTTEVIKVFDPADGTTIISQATNHYTFVGGILTGISKTRDI